MERIYLRARRVRRNIGSLRFVLGLALVAARGFGQGTLTITFDGFPKPGQGISIPYYSESGLLFEPLPGSEGFGRRNGTGTTLWPDNGNAYLQAAAGDSMSFGFENNSVFDLISIDLAGYSTVVPDFSVDFVGYKVDGSVVTENISGSGINFNTYHFDSRFTGLTRVEIPDFGSLDNVVLGIPEPGQGEFLVLGGLALWAARRFKSQRVRHQL